ncbi:MAG TPA: ABC transporter ATP-binding protein [Solirubrobacteraceae bacterium]|nr:ABC transporter ATP-binding protein [Solirubrobacteraceae bacterium]
MAVSAPQASSTAAASPDIRFEGVTKRFGDAVAVDALDLEIPKGTFFALLGPSGCGKTTSLRMIGGFEEPSEGRVFLAGQDVTDVPPFKRDVNTVFQSYALFPHMNVEKNVGFGLERRKVAKDEARKRVADVLELTQLTEFAKRKPTQLSGGQQQRVALARALVNRPQALLLDEPLGALDLRLRRQLQIELKRIHDEVGLTFVHVTHDQEEAMTMADEIAVMHKGRIEQRGSATELYEQPATEFVAGFLGTSNLIDATLKRKDGGLATYETHDGATVHAHVAREGAVRVGVRPEKLSIVDTPPEGCNVIRGRVDVASFLGVTLQYLIRTPGGDELTVVEQNRAGAHGGTCGPGQEVLLAWRPEHTFVVTKES